MTPWPPPPRAAAKLSEDWARFTASLPPAVEAAGIARAVLCHRLVGGRMHIRQVSTELGLAALTMADDEVTAEVTPHNISLTEDTLLQLGAVAKVVPPLRQVTDVAAMQEALRDGTVDIVATDHAPHTREEKSAGKNDLGKAPGGFPGVQTMLPVLLKLVGDGVIGYPDIVRVACEAPASIFRLSDRKGSVRPGADADLVLIDPVTPMTIRNEDQASKAGQTPFNGMTAPASPVLTMLRGEVIAERGKIVGILAGAFWRPPERKVRRRTPESGGARHDHASGDDIFVLGVLGNVVTAAADARNEDHAGWNLPRQEHRIVAGAADHSLMTIADVLSSLLEGFDDTDVHRRWRNARRDIK